MSDKIKILWLEDQPDEWRYIRRILESSKYELTIAEDVEQFFTYLGSTKYDLIIIDLIIWVSEDKKAQLEKYLGKSSIDSIAVGLEVLRKLTEKKISTPIIILTVMSETSDTGKMIFNEIKKLPREIEIVYKDAPLAEIEEKIRQAVGR